MGPDVASIGPLEPAVRDRVAEYRDKEGHPNYNSAIRALLQKTDEEAGEVNSAEQREINPPLGAEGSYPMNDHV